MIPIQVGVECAQSALNKSRTDIYIGCVIEVSHGITKIEMLRKTAAILMVYLHLLSNDNIPHLLVFASHETPHAYHA